MNYKISFQEMDLLVAKKLSNQQVLTIEEKRSQLQKLKKESLIKVKKNKY